MAGVTRVHGKAESGEFISRDLFFKNFDFGGAMAQADLDALVQEVQLTSTIEVIGNFVDGTSTSVNMVISGADVTSATGMTVTDIAGF